MFKDKIALIFGASSGIGKQIAIKLCDGGARVYNASRTENSDERVINLTCDVSMQNAVEQVVLGVGTACGKIDFLVYSAGFSMAAPIEHVTDEDFRYLFEVNFFGALRASKCAMPYLRKSTGRILFISSMGGVFPIAFDSFYSCSKAALDMLAKSINMEMRPYGVKATSLRPGGTATDFSFKRKVYNDSETGEYCKRLNVAVKNLCKIEQGGMSAESVAQSAIKILSADNPPVVCSAGLANKTLALSEKVLPTKLTNRINANQYFS